MKEALLLVFANKQDIQGGEDCLSTYIPFRAQVILLGGDSTDGFVYQTAMTPQEVQERLKLNQLKDKIWYVVPSCATTGEGLFEGLVSYTCATAHRIRERFG